MNQAGHLPLNTLPVHNVGQRLKPPSSPLVEVRVCIDDVQVGKQFRLDILVQHQRTHKHVRAYSLRQVCRRNGSLGGQQAHTKGRSTRLDSKLQFEEGPERKVAIEHASKRAPKKAFVRDGAFHIVRWADSAHKVRHAADAVAKAK